MIFSKKKFFFGQLFVGGMFLFPLLVSAQTCQIVSGGVDEYLCNPRTNTLPPNCVKEDQGGMLCEGIPVGYSIRAEGRLEISPASIKEGESARLTWSTQGAGGCQINGTPEPPNGTIAITPKKNASYTLSCKGLDGTGGSTGESREIGMVSINVIPSPASELTDDGNTCSGAECYNSATGNQRSTSEVTSTNLTYVPLEPFVGVNQTGQATFGELLSGFFKLLINVGAFFAVVVLVVGGITYMVSESTVNKLIGKERVKAAFIGLAILGASWLILNTINPELITFNKDLLSPAPSNIIVTRNSSLGQDGVQRIKLGGKKFNDLGKELNCPAGSVKNCVGEEVLVFEPAQKNNKTVKNAIKDFNEKYCKGVLYNVDGWRVVEKSGSLVGVPGTTMYVCTTK